MIVGSDASVARRKVLGVVLGVMGTAVVATAFATPASAELVVVLDGAGSGSVESEPRAPGGGIDCSNEGGGPAGPVCSDTFPLDFSAAIALTATPGAGSYFAGWTGDDIDGFGRATCNSGDANPCMTDDYEEFMPGTVTTITATFEVLPDPPMVVTGNLASGDEEWLRTFEGTVNPGGVPVDECYFEYGPTTSYGKSTACVDPNASELGNGVEAKEVSAKTDPLEPSTRYHVRLVASNIGGTARGPDRVFTTDSFDDPCLDGKSQDRRAEQGIAVLLLPDCMALEMVSPPQKSSVPARYPNVSADGSRVSFRAQAALGDEPPALFDKVTYVASRGASGWASESTVPDLEPRLAGIWSAAGSDFRPSFVPDFSHWFGFGATERQLAQGAGSAYEAGLGGYFRLLSAADEPFSSSASSENSIVFKSVFQGASADHSHVYFQPGERANYFPDDPIPFGFGAEHTNVYLAGVEPGGQPEPLQLLQRDRGGKVWGGNCGARLGGIGDDNGERNQGAVSIDGSRTYFSARASQPQGDDCDAKNKLRILERIETSAGPQIASLFVSECTRPAPGQCSNLDGDDLYQGASLDQTKLYFTTSRQLADSDLDEGNECSGLEPKLGCDLYLYDRARPAADRLVQVSAGEGSAPGVGARVFNGITAISADGSHVYFVAAGVLTEDRNPAGDEATAGAPNLYLWDADAEAVSFVATLAAAVSPEDLGDAIFPAGAANGLWGGQGTWRNNAYPVPATGTDGDGNEVGGDGHILVFESKAELTVDDADGRYRDVYRYDSLAETLTCISCSPGSSAVDPDEAPFDVDNRGEEGVLGTDFAESRRWVSEDGQVIGFLTAQPLLPGDINGVKDGYIWSAGEIARLPGMLFGAGAGIPAGEVGPFLSHDGSTAAFLTATPLLPQDGDSTADVYVARVNGGYPFPEPVRVCDPGDDCQDAEADSPTPPVAPSLVPRRGNARPNACARPARRARNLSQRAKRGRRNARRVAHNGKLGHARALHRRASRLAKAARRSSNRAKRCRSERRANGDGRAAK